MVTYGNQYWHKATDNNLKSIIPMNLEAFNKLQGLLDNAGLNYYAYEKNNAVVLAINSKDLDWFKKIIGYPLADRITVQKSLKVYSPPQKNIIGNYEWKYIPQKSCFSTKETDVALKMADLLNKQGIKFSGRIYANKTTLTVSAEDFEKLKEINAVVLKMRDDFEQIKDKEIIGTIPYSRIKHRHTFKPDITVEEYKKVEPYMKKLGIEYSGLIQGNQVVITMEEEKAREFYSKFDVAFNLYAIYGELKKDGFSAEQINLLSPAIMVSAEKDFLGIINNYANPAYTDEQNQEIMKHLIKHLDRPESERMLDKDGILQALIACKNKIDTEIALKDISENHSYSAEQFEVIKTAFLNNVSVDFLSELDESYSISELNEIFQAYNEFNADKVNELMENHAKALVQTNISDIKGEFIEFAVNQLSDNQTIRNAHENSVQQDYLLEINNSVDRLLTELITDIKQIEPYTVSEISNFYDTFFADETLRNDIYNIVAERVGNALTQLEAAREKAKDLGIPFSDRFVNGIDDDDELNMYAYDGSMTPEDYDKWKLLNELSEITGTDDDTPYRLIEAFEANPDEARNTIFEILNDNNLAKKVFTAIADSEYINDNSSKLNDNEKSFPEQVNDVLNGKANRYDDIKVCDTPQILIDIGCEQLPMLYTQNHLKKAVKPKNLKKHTHGLNKEQIEKLPSLLENPVMIYDSLSRNDSIVAVTSDFDNENNPIIVSIQPNGEGKYKLERVNSNFITSVHGRENFVKHLEKEIEADNLLYVDKTKSQELFSVLGLQFPKGLNSLDFNSIIHQSRNIVKASNEEKIAENEQKTPEKTADDIKSINNDIIHSVAVTFELDEELLRHMMKLNLTEENIDEFGRFDKLKKTVNKTVAKEFIEKIEGTTIIPPKVNMKIDKILRKFILTGEFDFSAQKFEEKSSISESMVTSQTDKEQKTPERTFDDNDFKEKNVTLMSDADEVSDVSYQEDDIKSIKLEFSGDSSSLDEIKNMALSLGAAITMDNENGILSVDTYDNHKDELLNKAYELNVSTSDEQEEPVTVDLLSGAAAKQSEADKTAIERQELDNSESILTNNKEKSFSEQVDDVLNGTLPFYTNLKVCDTPQILIDIGFRQFPMLYTQKHLKDALHKKSSKNSHWHGLTIEQIKSIPEKLSKPAIIMDSISPTNNNSIIAILNYVDNENAPIIVSIKPDGKGIYQLKNVSSNFITSIYGKDKGFANFVERAALSGNILFWDKKESQELFSCQGLQLPKALNNLDSNSIIHQSRNIVKAFNEEKITENEQKTPEKTADDIKSIKHELRDGDVVTFPDRPDVWRVSEISDLQISFENVDENSPNRSFSHIDFGANRDNLQETLKYVLVSDAETKEHEAEIPITESEPDISSNKENTNTLNKPESENSQLSFFDMPAEIGIKSDEPVQASRIHAAFEQLLANHDFSEQTEQFLRRTETFMEHNDYTAIDTQMFKLGVFAQNYGSISRIDNKLFNGKLKDIIDELNSSLSQDENTERQNFTIKDDSLGEGGAKAKFNANINAIQTLQKIEAENRNATPEEQEILSKYVGWGGLANAFDESKSDWANEYAQLKDLLTEKEYSSARASTLDSFYTAPAVIDGIYKALEQFGFKGGNVLEPAMGIGNFFGRMPADMQKNSNLYGVEIDSISGRIAQKLYPNADIAVQGFEKNKFQNGCFDVAVGNVPFGELAFKDNKHGTTKLHDYFFAETLDKVKDGGIVAFVTSAGTLDKRDKSTRLALSDKTDFIGAIRLPGGKNGAFKDNAGTEVTTDIIFLQKNSHKSVAEMSDIPDWVHIGETADGLPINKYFAENPDMVLGTVIEGNKLYGSGTMVIADDSTDLKEQIQNAVSKLSANISKEPAREVYAKIDNQTVQIPSELRNYSYFDFNNNIYFKTSENECTLKYSNSSNKEDKAAYARIKAFIQLRDCTRDLLTAQEQDKPDSEIEALQAKLNTLYDSFNKKYKLLHGRTNKSMLKDDISYSLVAALEKKIENNKLIEKSDLFTKRTIKPAKVVSHVDTALEALMLSIAEKAKVDFAYMEKLTDLPRTALIDELHGEIYPVPGTDEYQSASEYLSGDIKVKLTEAETALNNGDSRMKDNIEALKGAMPEPLKAGDIDVKIGATWIDKKYYQQFIYETFDTPYYHRENGKKGIWQRKLKDITVDYSPYSCEWEICNSSEDKSVKVTKEFGTAKMNAYDIMESLLNLKDPKINKKVYVDGKKKYVIDPEATKLAQRKAEKIKSAWNDWIFKDPERRAELVQKYNDLFNSIRPREYDGSHLRFPGMNSEIQLHSHQKNAVAHSLFGGNTLFAHCVGAGKTYEMIASAMESKRLGLCTKSLFAVPNHLTEQIGSDFRKLYPNSNILVATNADFNKDNRQALFSKIAAGNFDAVIIGHSQLSMLKMSQDRQEKILNTQINDIVKGIQDLKNSEGSNFQVKAMERTKKSLEKRLESLKKENQDDVITFEQLGIDKLYVDEAHEFKNLFTPTKLQNVSGISSSASQKALDLFMKCQYLDEKTGGKGIVFATGTPLSNSVTELHTMMRYLEYDFLKSKNLQHFDNWVTVFGEQKTDWELAPAGNKFKQRTRIANYTGLPELISMYKQVADVRTADTLDLDVPECEMHIVNVEATDFQKELVQELADRADDVQDGKVDPTEDNMLRITSDGRKLGLDPRLINPDFEDNQNTKLNQCVNNVFKIYQDTKEDKLTQIIFCDLGVPHSDKSKAQNKKSTENIADTDDDNKSVAEKESLEEECDFCVYDDIKSKLMAKGVPENEIAFIHSAKTEKAKSELFEKVRSGEVRVLLGSTGKMGTGTNVQDKLIAIHDLDIPWRPADMEQRKGRIVRQGNQNEKVHVYRYVTKGTFDAYSYQTLENKQKFISQIQTSNAPVRKCEDVDQQALNYSEIKALCTGDERIKEKMSLDNEVKELKLLKAEYTNTKYEMEDKIKSFAAVEQRMNHTIDNLKTDLEHCKNLPIDPETNLPKFAIEIKNVTYTDRTEAAKALESACVNMIANVGEAITIGSFHGFPLSVEYSGLENGIVAKLHGAAIHRSDFSISFANNLKRLESSIFNIEQKIDNVKTELQKKIIDVNVAKHIVQQPFTKEKELETKEQRLTELTDELNKAAMAEKLANPNKQRTCYFEMARMKKMSMTLSQKKNKSQSRDKNKSQDKAM